MPKAWWFTYNLNRSPERPISIVHTFGEFEILYEYCTFVSFCLSLFFHVIKSIYIFYIAQEINCADRIRAERFCAQFNDDSDDNMSADLDRIKVTLPPEGHGKRIVLTSMLAPYSYTYLTVIRSLDKLLNYGLIESDFVRICIDDITSQVQNGQCRYGKFQFAWITIPDFEDD